MKPLLFHSTLAFSLSLEAVYYRARSSEINPRPGQELVGCSLTGCVVHARVRHRLLSCRPSTLPLSSLKHK